MAEQRDRPETDRLLSAFVDAAPRTVTDVALAAGITESDAEPGLEALCEAGELERRSVSGVDISAQKAAETAEIDVDEPITLYHLPAATLADSDATPPTADDEIGRRLERMSIPGASDLMRNWRRDAVRAAYDYLMTSGSVAPDTLVDEVYPGHEAAFDDPAAWWFFVRPRLYRLPGVAVDDGEWFIEQRPKPRHG